MKTIIERDAFLEAIHRLGNVDPVRLDSIVRQLVIRSRKVDAPTLAEHLIGAGVLTKYQADRVLQGAGDELVVGPFVTLDSFGIGRLGPVFKSTSIGDGNRAIVELLQGYRPCNAAVAKSEIMALSKVDQQCVVPPIDVGFSSQTSYIAWPYVDGTTLESTIKQNGKLKVEDITRIAALVAEGLHACHQSGFVHGTLTSSNILVDDDKPYVMDYGEGYLLANEDEPSLKEIMTGHSTVPSGVDFTCPEGSLTAHSDQYSLGCVLYHALTGQVPFPKGSLVQKIAQHKLAQPTPLTDLNPQIPVGVATVVMRLLRKEPRDRYPDLKKVAEELWPFAQPENKIQVGSVAAEEPQARLSGNQCSELFARLPSGYDELVHAVKQINTQYRTAFASAFQRHFNQEIRARLERIGNDYASKKSIAAWIKGELDQFGFAIRHPDGGYACNLITLAGYDKTGVFLLESKEGRRRTNTTPNLLTLLDFSLMDLND